MVRGPLGAGKTTVARSLARRLGARYVSIDALLEREPWDGGSERLFLRANVRAAARARPALRSGRPVVLDGNFYWPRAIDDLGRRLPWPQVVLRLDVPLATCLRRDAARPHPYGAQATREVFAKCARVRRGIAIDGRGSAEETVRAALERLPRGWRTARSAQRR